MLQLHREGLGRFRGQQLERRGNLGLGKGDVAAVNANDLRCPWPVGGSSCNQGRRPLRQDRCERLSEIITIIPGQNNAADQHGRLNPRQT